MEHKKLIDYLPEFLAAIREMKLIASAEQPEITLLLGYVNEGLQNQFVIDANEAGLMRYEALLGIENKQGITLDERRFSVLAKLGENGIYNLQYLKDRLAALCGEDGYSLRVDENRYFIEIKVALVSKNNLRAVAEMVDQIIPCNLIRSVDLLYNQHELFSLHKHADLCPYTHDYLRNEVMP